MTLLPFVVTPDAGPHLGSALKPRDDAEEAFILRLERGDALAIGELYDKHHSAVRAFCRRLVGENSAAEDLVHEVFVSLPRAIHNFRGQSSLRTFLISIAVNHARHHVRAASRRRNAISRLGEEPSGRVVDPEQVAERQQLAHALNQALDALPLDQRVAFVLCEIEEHSSRVAAEIVGAPEGTVRTRVFHAKRKLREELEQRGFR
jgi:RNA polymerase sigma-70 factor (ECF subfamily)